MKLRTLLLTLLTVILSLGSCRNVLDMAPDGKLTMDQIFSENDRVGAFLNTCYANIPVKGTRYFFWSRGPVNWSDESWDTDAEAESWIMSGRMYNGDASAGNHPVTNISADAGNGNYWASYWSAIRNCTIFLSRIDKATVKNPADRARWKAEAHLLRAYYYSELLKWFGAVLPIEREAFEFSDDFSTVTKASYYEVVKFIMEDCDAALATAELPWRITTASEAGRVHKAMAEAIKSKMILFAASPLNNNGQSLWQEAYQVNKTSLENLRANGYELYNRVNLPQTYLSDVAFIGPDKNEKSALYNEYFTQTMAYSANPVDKETIYQSREGQGNIWDIDGIGSQDGYKSGTCPTQELVDAYETSDGQPILDLDKPYLDDQHLQPNYNAANKLYNPNDPYKNRDPRFYASIYYNGSKRKAMWNFAEAPESVENYPAPIGNRTRIIATYINEPQTGIHPTVRRATRTGYYERKFLHPNSGNDNPIGGANWKLFRLGEVILNFAEAAAEAGQLADAVKAVNEIRTRAGMPVLPASLGQADLVKRIRAERRVELAMEENRYFDVRRWSKPTDDLAKTDRWITAMEITRNADGTFSYKRRNVRGTERKNYTQKFIWVPIPLDEANRLRSITGADWQNFGW
ncbi:RagB/SusD family nutrient uptake outer membrane protein [Dyadobacter sandarakinus]|uniref:RagB/SusD family nutrient uptake outer membrane protein n=1 Tax=Dyadobacter sandarakinus TaxID=2747268 RepID=A0ABX7I8X2_9BACT|nr:RagB/SusD family nutrient uptake outer membrane protein [Dyadobacter sandarakinus]QRR02158.1 RagB/SusD family nutrient uptake outer membrane protein [Dyadobacter sandarakinus]